MTCPEFRKDPVTGDLVVISKTRSKRPTDFGKKCADEAGVPADGGPVRDEKCPFCPGNESMTPPEIARSGGDGSGGWTTRSFDNLFPFVSESTDTLSAECKRDVDCVFEGFPAFGKHEILVTNPDHSKSPTKYSQQDWAEIVSGLKSRFEKLEEKFSHIMAFMNYGKSAGASLSHPHIQIISVNITPPGTIKETAGMESFSEKSGGKCIYCSIVETEKGGPRAVVNDDPDFLVFCPWASKYQFETCIVPRKHVKSLNEVDTIALARILEKTFAQYRGGMCEVFPFNMCIYCVNTGKSAHVDFHFHIEIMPKLSKFAGLEKGWLIIGNSMCPEDAATSLRGEGK